MILFQKYFLLFVNQKIILGFFVIPEFCFLFVILLLNFQVSKHYFFVFLLSRKISFLILIKIFLKFQEIILLVKCYFFLNFQIFLYFP